MHLTATHINYYHLCHRKLWLFAHGINMEQQSVLVAEGKLISETTYTQRANKYKEVDLGHIKIDHYDAQKKIIREVKKSDKLEFVHIAQLKYYLYVLRRLGITDVQGLLEYPKLRKTKTVILTEQDCKDIPLWEVEAKAIIAQAACPPLVRKSFCKKCAYYDYCYV